MSDLKLQKALSELIHAQDIDLETQKHENFLKNLEGLKDPNSLVQKAAILALKKQANPMAAIHLFIYANAHEGLQDKTLRAEALGALTNCLTGSEQGLLESLLLFAKDLDPNMKANALLCLGRIHDPQARHLQPIILGLLSLDEVVNKAAAIALSEGFRQEHDFLIKFLVEIYEDSRISLLVREALLIAFTRVSILEKTFQNRLRPLIAKELESKVPNICKTAIVILEGLYDDENPVPIKVAQLIKRMLFDVNKEIRIVSASFLNKYGLR